MESPTIKQILIVWADSYDKEIPFEVRRDAYCELLKTCVQYGYKKSDITTSVFNDIIRETVPQEYRPLSKRQSWTRMAERDLSSAMEIMFPSVKLATLTEEDLAKDESIVKRNDEAEKIHQEAMATKITEAALKLERENKAKEFPAAPRLEERPKAQKDMSVFEELGFEP